MTDELEKDADVVTDETTETESTDDASKGSDETKQTEYDKTQQQLDQERANARRAREALEEVQSERAELVDQLAHVRTELSDVKSKLQGELTKKEYTALADLDPDTTDVPDVVRAFQSMTQKVAKLESELAEANGFIKTVKDREQQTQQIHARNAMEEEIYSACDGEYGAQYRNDAIKLADKKVSEGLVDAPKSQVQGLLLMRKCYAEIAAKKAKPAPKEKTVATDTGLRGRSYETLSESEDFKTGTVGDVRADMAKKMKAGKWARAFISP